MLLPEKLIKNQEQVKTEFKPETTIMAAVEEQVKAIRKIMAKQWNCSGDEIIIYQQLMTPAPNDQYFSVFNVYQVKNKLEIFMSKEN